MDPYKILKTISWLFKNVSVKDKLYIIYEPATKGCIPGEIEEYVPLFEAWVHLELIQPGYPHPFVQLQ